MLLQMLSGGDIHPLSCKESTVTPRKFSVLPLSDMERLPPSLSANSVASPARSDLDELIPCDFTSWLSPSPSRACPRERIYSRSLILLFSIYIVIIKYSPHD